MHLENFRKRLYIWKKKKKMEKKENANEIFFMSFSKQKE